jgi:hypothetical protein
MKMGTALEMTDSLKYMYFSLAHRERVGVREID